MKASKMWTREKGQVKDVNTLFQQGPYLNKGTKEPIETMTDIELMAARTEGKDMANKVTEETVQQSRDVKHKE